MSKKIVCCKNGDISQFKMEKLTKPKPEDVANDFLDAKKTSAMFNLVEFIRSKKIGIQWASSEAWSLNYKGKKLGSLKIGARYDSCDEIAHSWHFRHHRSYLDCYYNMEDCELKSFVFEHIYAKCCGNCIATNGTPNEIKAGYMNPTDCGCWPLRIYNPDGNALEYTKQLIEFRMECILADKK